MAPEITVQDSFLAEHSPLPELISKDPKITFGRVVMPYLLGIKKENYIGIDEAAVEAADPEKFRPYLFPGNGGEYTVNGIALSSAEYGYMVRFPNAFGRAVNNSEYHRQRLDENIDRRREKADTQEAETLEKRLGRMQGMLRGVLLEKEQIEILSHEARNPGYANVPARTMREAVISTHDISFKRILEVVGREKEWTKEQAILAAKAVDVRLFFDRANRVGNWRSMLRLASDYGRRREILFRNRMRTIERRLGAATVHAAS